MLLAKVVRRWGIPILAAALFITGVILWQDVDPSTQSMPRRYSTYLPDTSDPSPIIFWLPFIGSILVLAGIVLSLVWAIVSTRRRKGSAPDGE